MTTPTSLYKNLTGWSVSLSPISSLFTGESYFLNDVLRKFYGLSGSSPGFTATDLNNFQGTRTVQQAAREPVRLALLDANGPTGTFSNEDGPVPW